MNENMNTDNLLEDDAIKAENSVTPQEDDTVAEDFFSQLDKQVMGETLDQPIQAQEEQVLQQEPVQEQQAQPEMDVANLEKRYSDSSREAKRLNTRLNELEPYMPLLNAMKEDPNLISHVRGYFEGGGSAPTSVKEQLGLDEDFVFDYDDALSDPNSSSAKLFNATVDGVVQRRLGDFAKQQSMQSRKASEEAAFKTKHNVSEEDYEDLMNYAKSHRLSLEDVYYLKNRDNRDTQVAGNAREEVIQQMKNVRQMPTSVASSGNVQREEKSVDDAVFDKLLAQGAGLDKLM
jgi:phage host-nuclease inhibitor protein Gam